MNPKCDVDYGFQSHIGDACEAEDGDEKYEGCNEYDCSFWMNHQILYTECQMEDGEPYTDEVSDRSDNTNSAITKEFTLNLEKKIILKEELTTEINMITSKMSEKAFKITTGVQSSNTWDEYQGSSSSNE